MTSSWDDDGPADGPGGRERWDDPEAVDLTADPTPESVSDPGPEVDGDAEPSGDADEPDDLDDGFGDLGAEALAEEPEPVEGADTGPGAPEPPVAPWSESLDAAPPLPEPSASTAAADPPSPGNPAWSETSVSAREPEPEPTAWSAPDTTPEPEPEPTAPETSEPAGTTHTEPEPTAWSAPDTTPEPEPTPEPTEPAASAPAEDPPGPRAADASWRPVEPDAPAPMRFEPAPFPPEMVAPDPVVDTEPAAPPAAAPLPPPVPPPLTAPAPAPAPAPATAPVTALDDTGPRSLPDGGSRRHRAAAAPSRGRRVGSALTLFIVAVVVGVMLALVVTLAIYGAGVAIRRAVG